MNLPENDYQILRLTDAFYNAYPNPPYVEILKKKRAYNCLIFQTHYDYFICIPYRSEIAHKYAYHFKSSKRSRIHKSGLDYSKIVIVCNTDFLDSTDAIIDKDEYNETMKFFDKIKRDALNYVEEYANYISGTSILSPEEFTRKYGFSSLQYFHEELKL